MTLSTHSASSLSLLARPGSRAAMGNGFGATNGSSSVRGKSHASAAAAAGGTSNGERVVSEGSAPQATGTVSAAEPGSENKRGNTNGAGSGALFYHRSAAGPATGAGAAGSGGTATSHGRTPMQGNKPLLLPKPTMAAHNGRLLLEQEWGFARC